MPFNLRTFTLPGNWGDKFIACLLLDTVDDYIAQLAGALYSAYGMQLSISRQRFEKEVIINRTADDFFMVHIPEDAFIKKPAFDYTIYPFNTRYSKLLNQPMLEAVN